jgi:3'-phosphoadenosine 5'-phosphosulfate (PAPS) 3'-phosphatase
MAFGLSSCSKGHEMLQYKKVNYDITVQGYVRDTVSLSNIDINLHLTKQPPTEKQLQKFIGKKDLPSNASDELKIMLESIENDVDFYMRKTFGKHITYDITAQGVVKYSFFAQFDVDREFKK